MFTTIRRVSAARAGSLAVKGLAVVSATGFAMTAVPTAAVAAPSTHVSAPLLQSVVGLRQGARGTDVKSVQQALIDSGVHVVGGADGIFGPATKSAVTSFQQSNGLTANGEVDAATASALGLSGSTPSATPAGAGGLSLGAKGDAVVALQQALMKSGVYLPGGADGIFGNATKTAVSSFQRWNGLDVTGTVTPATEKLLAATATGYTAPSTTTPTASSNGYVGLSVGSRGDKVKELQKAMIDAGISVRGGADGIFGPATKASLIAYQKSNGLTASGGVDTATAGKLGLGGASAGSPSAPSPAASSGYVGMKVGAQGDKVKELQRALLNTGLTLRGGADGVFGNATKATLILFQSVNGIEQTGVVSDKGAELLGLGTSSGPQGITSRSGYAVFGERGTRVKQVQQQLLNAGVSFAGGADGIFGASTAGAIMDYQRREGLAVTGKIDSATAAKLGAVKAPAPPPPSSANVTIDTFPVQGRCWFGDTWHGPRGGGRLHEGVDIIAANGKELYAVVDGTISKQYWDHPGALAGNGVRVAQANGTYFTYLHMSAFADGIGVGVKVQAGQLIGYVGETGNAATAHLHFEVHPNGGAAVNPYPIVKAVDDCNNTASRG